MERIRLETYMDKELFRDLEKRATLEGKEVSEILEEAVASYLSGVSDSRTSELLEGIQKYQRERGTPQLSEEEAMEMANEEVHDYRGEHQEIYLKHNRGS